MPVLPLDDEAAFIGDGDYIDPVRVFEDVELGIDIAVGQADLVASGGQPRTAEEILAVPSTSYHPAEHHSQALSVCFQSWLCPVFQFCDVASFSSRLR